MRRCQMPAFIVLLMAAAGCVSPGEASLDGRQGTILAAGQHIPVNAPVVTFLDEGGYDAHVRHCHFDPGRVLPLRPAAGCNTPERFRPRPTTGMAQSWVDDVEQHGWSLESLRERLSMFVFHYDVCMTSARCFRVLQDVRGLSVHFLLDVDGTIYQTLDLAHRARHAGVVNDQSIGIEIAHIGAYPPGDPTLARYYTIQPDGRYLLEIPPRLDPPDPGVFETSRPGLYRGIINGREYVMPDFTEAQYLSLEALIGALSTAFPRIRRRVPRDENGLVVDGILPVDEVASWEGLCAHFHVSRVKADPGPAFDWDRLTGN